MQLPHNFRATEVLAFHARDPQQRAERVTGHCIDKGLMWHGHPAQLRISLHPDHAEVTLSVDGPPADPAHVTRLAGHMLGLSQPVEAFEALSWAITGQQISVAAAVSVRRRLIETAGLRHSGGLACYPDAATLARLDEATLQSAGLSATKARSLLSVARLATEGHLPLDDWLHTASADTIRARLASIRGIGPWTINYTLLRGFASVDGSLHGDVAVRRGLQKLLGRAEKIDADEAETWLARFAPWRALVAAHLWAG